MTDIDANAIRTIPFPIVDVHIAEYSTNPRTTYDHEQTLAIHFESIIFCEDGTSPDILGLQKAVSANKILNNPAGLKHVIAT